MSQQYDLGIRIHRMMKQCHNLPARCAKRVSFVCFAMRLLRGVLAVPALDGVFVPVRTKKINSKTHESKESMRRKIRQILSTVERVLCSCQSSPVPKPLVALSGVVFVVRCGRSCDRGLLPPLACPRASGGKALFADQLRRSPVVADADSLPDAAESAATPPGGCWSEG